MANNTNETISDINFEYYNIINNKKVEKNTNLAEVSNILLVSLQNKNKIEKIKSSTVNSLIKLDLQQKEIEEENQIGYKYRSQKAINKNNKILSYLQETQNEIIPNISLSDKLQKMLDIKNNSESFQNYKFNNIYNKEESIYYLEDILNLIIHNIKNKNTKIFAINLLKKIKLLKRKLRNKNKTPILSLYLKKILPIFFNNIQKKEELLQLKQKATILNKEEQRKKLSLNKNFIEYNFKVKYINPIEQYKDRNSILYQSLPTEDKKLINTLLFIESKDLPNITNQLELKNKNLLMTKQNLIRTITPFISDLMYSKNIMYNFNKRNNYNIFKNERNLFSILESAFLSMDSLISKAIFSVKSKVIIINLFFFWKPLVSNNYYSNSFSKFAVIYENNLKNLSLILSKLLKKTVNFQFTRLYYPYNDSNIFASFIGSLSYFIKFTFMSKSFLKKINFFITKRKYYRLKYRYIPSVITGINIKLAGRILTVRNKRKVKSRKVQWGSLARNKNSLKSISRFTNKNKIGAFSITVKNNTVVFK